MLPTEIMDSIVIKTCDLNVANVLKKYISSYAYNSVIGSIHKLHFKETLTFIKKLYLFDNLPSNIHMLNSAYKLSLKLKLKQEQEKELNEYENELNEYEKEYRYNNYKLLMSFL